MGMPDMYKYDKSEKDEEPMELIKEKHSVLDRLDTLEKTSEDLERIFKAEVLGLREEITRIKHTLFGE